MIVSSMKKGGLLNIKEWHKRSLGKIQHKRPASTL